MPDTKTDARPKMTADERLVVEQAEKDGRVVNRREATIADTDEYGAYFEAAVTFRGTDRIFEEVRVAVIRDTAAIYSRKANRSNGRWKVYDSSGLARVMAQFEAFNAHGFDVRLASPTADMVLFPVTKADLENIAAKSTPASVHPAASLFQTLYGSVVTVLSEADTPST